MNQKNRKPAIRFKAFNDPWEQRKVSEIANFSKGSGYSKGDLTKTGTPIILYGRLYTKYKFFINEVDTFTKPKEGAVYSQGNEVIIPASGETAEEIARASAIEKSGFLLGGDLNIIRPVGSVNPLFLALTFSNGEPQKQLTKRAQGKSVVHVRNSDIKEVFVSYPSQEEQSQIVAVFRNLEQIITLHQRKLDKLQNVKKACLEKMFPQNGESVPRIRFKGFTDTWEQRKFGGLLESVPSKTFIKSPEINGKYEVVQQGNDPIMGYANGYPCEDYQETVIFGDHTLSLYKPQAPFFVATDGVRIVKGKDKSDGFFLFTLLEKYKPQSEGYKRYFSILSDTSCYFAKNLSEQQKIGEYFECINSLITLHQREHL